MEECKRIERDNDDRQHDKDAENSKGQDSIRKVLSAKVLYVSGIKQPQSVVVVVRVKMIHWSRGQKVKGNTEKFDIRKEKECSKYVNEGCSDVPFIM